MTRRRGGLWLAVLLVSSTALFAPPEAGAQVVAPPEAGQDVLSSSVRGWSPLRRVADPARLHPLGMGAPVSRLLGRAGPMGLSWDAGNPAGLALEVEERAGSVSGATLDRSGAFRRPLEPGETDARDVVAVGRTPIGERTSGAGTLGAFWGRDIAPAYANVVHPHTPSPHVLADTSLSSFETMGATVEGGLAGTMGDWSLGLAAGVRAQDTRTVAAVVRRVRRHTQPGVTVGVARAFGGGSLRVGVHGGLLKEATTIVLHPLAAPTRVLRLRGFTEPVPSDITGQYFHRLSRTHRTAGLSAAGTLERLRWVAGLEVASLDESQFHQVQNDAPRERWGSDVIRASARVRYPLMGEGSLEVAGSHTSLDGGANRPGIEETTFSSDESDWELDGLVAIPLGTRWRWTALTAVQRIDRRHRDHDARLSATLEAWSVSAGTGIQFEPTAGVRVGAAYRWSRYLPSGRLPDLDSLGELTRSFVLPQYLLYATETGSGSAMIRVDYASTSRGTLSATVRRGRASPVGLGAPTATSLLEGDRGEWSLGLSWTPAGAP